MRWARSRRTCCDSSTRRLSRVDRFASADGPAKEPHMVRCVAFLAVLLAATGSVPVQAQMTTGSTPGATAAARVLEALFADEWERGLRDYPERATEFGDPRYND